MRIRLPLNAWTLAGMVAAIIPLVIWEWVSLVGLARSAHVWVGICWVPAIATSGVMLSATALHMTPELDEPIRRYAGRLAAVGIVAGIAGSGAQHYIEAAGTDPSAWLALPVGGIPVCMGGLLVHLLSMVFAQQRRQQAEADRTRGRAVAELAEARETASIRARERAAEAAHAKRLADDARRGADEKRRLADETERLATAAKERADAAQRVLDGPRLVGLPGGKGKASKANPAGVQRRARDYLLAQHRAGRDFHDVMPRELADAISGNYDTCRSRHKAWKAALAEDLEAAG